MENNLGNKIEFYNSSEQNLKEKKSRNVDIIVGVISVVVLFILLLLIDIVKGRTAIIFQGIWPSLMMIDILVIFFLVTKYIIKFFTKNTLNILPKNDEGSFTNQINHKESDRKTKKAIFIVIIAIIVIISLVFLLDNGPGLGSGLGLLFLIPLLPVALVGFPIYFILLAVRYSREKSEMDFFDKATFYTLLVALVLFVIYKLIQ